MAMSRLIARAWHGAASLLAAALGLYLLYDLVGSGAKDRALRSFRPDLFRPLSLSLSLFLFFLVLSLSLSLSLLLFLSLSLSLSFSRVREEFLKALDFKKDLA